MKRFETPNKPSRKYSEIDTRMATALACLVGVIGAWSIKKLSASISERQ